MLYFFLFISLIINPYLLLLLNSSITNLRFPKIYSIILILNFFIFTNLRSHGEFLYSSTGDDAEDYSIGIKQVINKFSIFDILSGQADGKLEHIDRIFGLYQLFLAKLFSPESIPILCSITFGILILSTLYTYPFLNNGIIKFNANLLISIIIINPYLIYLNQHLYRQAIALGVLLSITLPLFLRLFIFDKYVKNNKLIYLFMMLSIFLAFGLHRGSTIPILILFSISTILSSGIISQIGLLFNKFILGRRLILIIFLIIFSILFSFFTSKYLDKFLLYFFLDLRTRVNTVGLRTASLGLFISAYMVYTCYSTALKNYFKPVLKNILIIFSILNFLISSFCIFTPGMFVRLLFSTNIISLFSILISHNYNKILIKIITLILGISTYLFYIFLREGYWGKGNYFLPFLY